MEGGYEKIGDYHCGRALDDKIGGYITARMLASLYRNDIQLDYELIVVNSVQEEVGLHGAKMIASNYDVNMAIAIDVCHCTESPAYNPSKHGSTTSGKGPVIMTGPSIHNTLSQFIFNIAKDNKIGLQRTSSGRSSGTNTDSYAYSKGVPSALLKLPLKYMHTTVEMVHEEDVEQTIEVLYQVVTSKKLTSLDLVGNLL
jgi:putative aminopeptidase FrvX